MAYTNTEPASVGTSFTNTEPSTVGGTISQIEPIGFGLMPFGDPSENKLTKEYGRGFGDPKTRYTNNNDE